jgi:hypothetical protein
MRQRDGYMKSRRHRAIDKICGTLLMKKFKMNKKDSKSIRKRFKELDKEYKKEMAVYLKSKSFKEICEIYKR